MLNETFVASHTFTFGTIYEQMKSRLQFLLPHLLVYKSATQAKLNSYSLAGLKKKSINLLYL